MNAGPRMPVGASNNRGLADCHRKCSGEAVDQLPIRKVLMLIVDGIVLNHAFTYTLLHFACWFFFCLAVHDVWAAMLEAERGRLLKSFFFHMRDVRNIRNSLSCAWRFVFAALVAVIVFV